MSKSVKLCKIGIYDLEGNLLCGNIAPLMNHIQTILESNTDSIVKSVDGESIRTMRYYQRDGYSTSEFVIPFGKLKSGATYKASENGKTLEEVNEKLFDIACMYYSQTEHLAILTVSKTGPSEKYIQKYLQCFLHNNVQIRVEPILHSTGLVKVEKAKYVKSITISLDLNSSTQQLCRDTCCENNTMISLLSELAQKSNEDLNSKTFNLVLGLGRNKNESLEKEAALDILSNLNIEDNVIKEITVAYKNSEDEKIEPARLKDSYMEVRALIDADGPEYILGKADEIISQKRNVVRTSIEKFYRAQHEVQEFLL